MYKRQEDNAPVLPQQEEPEYDDQQEMDIDEFAQYACQYASDIDCSISVSYTHLDENGLDKVEAMKHTYKKLKLSCLVVLGGNGSQKTANMLSEDVYKRQAYACDCLGRRYPVQ